VTGWQVLPVTGPEFEEEALHACEMILVGDPRIGKIPGEKRKTTPKAKAAAAPKPAKAKAKPAKAKAKPAARATHR
jgi:hypothetical protein